MRVLLDTHVLLWALRDPDSLSPAATALLADPATELLVSAATAWEIATKHRIGKLPDAEPLLLGYEGHLSRLGARELPIASRHALAAGSLEWAHRDPFDRVIAAQSILEGVPLVSRDAAFVSLPSLRVLW